MNSQDDPNTMLKHGMEIVQTAVIPANSTNQTMRYPTGDFQSTGHLATIKKCEKIIFTRLVSIDLNITFDHKHTPNGIKQYK